MTNILHSVLTSSTITLALLIAQVDSLLVLKGNVNQCTCPGDTLIFECTVTGGPIGVTIWTGTAFDCQQTENRLTLLHNSLFMDTIRCNDGAILARGINMSMGNENLTSQLNVTVNSQMNGKSVECFYDPFNGSQVQLLGNTSIRITTDLLRLPMDIMVNISKDPPNLIFQWTPVSFTCPSLHYVITFDCGLCPNTTRHTQVTCTDIILVESGQCWFTVQTAVCGTLLKNESASVFLTLEDPPQVTVIPTYTYDLKQLTTLELKLMEQGTPDGTISSYSVNYSIQIKDKANPNSEEPCASANFPASSCEHKMCVCTFDVGDFSCEHMKMNGTIEVTVTAINVLGSGPSFNTTIDLTNTFVNVHFNQDHRAINCIFPHPTENNFISVYNCTIIVYGWNMSQIIVGNQNSNHSVIVNLVMITIDDFQQFTITASDGTHSVQVEGLFPHSTTTKTYPTSDTTDSSAFSSILAVVVPIAAVTILGLSTILLGICGVFRFTRNLKASERQTESQEQHENVYSSPERAPQTSVELMDFQQVPTDSTTGIYSSLNSEATDNQKVTNNRIYADVCHTSGSVNKMPFAVLSSDDKVEYAELKHHPEVYVNTSKCHWQPDSCPRIHFDADAAINLDILLIQLRDEVTENWFEFGLKIGVPHNLLKKYSEHPSDQCMIEVLDYWLRHHNKPSWKEVAEALNSIGLTELSHKISQVYSTGRLPIDVDLDDDIRQSQCNPCHSESLTPTAQPLPPRSLD